jgi:hypothetical protein
MFTMCLELVLMRVRIISPSNMSSLIGSTPFRRSSPHKRDIGDKPARVPRRHIKYRGPHTLRATPHNALHTLWSRPGALKMFLARSMDTGVRRYPQISSKLFPNPPPPPTTDIATDDASPPHPVTGPNPKANSTRSRNPSLSPNHKEPRRRCYTPQA